MIAKLFNGFTAVDDLGEFSNTSFIVGFCFHGGSSLGASTSSLIVSVLAFGFALGLMGLFSIAPLQVFSCLYL